MRNAHVWTLIGLLALAVVVTSLKAKEPAPAKKPNIGKLRHVVLFKFKDDAPAKQIQKIEDAFGELPDQIPEIADFEWGTNNSPEGLADGFTHCFFVTFHNEAGRKVYLPHPAHQEFVALLKPSLDKVLVIDYVAQE